MSLVEISGLTKTYGPIKAVDQFNLTADRAEIVALVGPDGAGKTTIFRATCGLIGFDSGLVTVAGLDVSKDFEKIKPHLGYMPQVFSLYPDLSVEENLNFYAGLFGVSREDLLKKKRVLYDFSGLGPFAKRRAGALSGGMKQKLSLSCALVHDPEVLVLDEPTTGVDPVSREQFWNILKDLKSRGAAIVVSTPYMDEVALADRAAFVYGGRKLGEGTPAELATLFRGRVYRIKGSLSGEQLDGLSRIEGLAQRRFGSSAYLYTDSAETISNFEQRLLAIGILPEAVEEASPSLEDAFIQLMADRPR
jgi:ABC-2 type transport system ATP-binding protein